MSRDLQMPIFKVDACVHSELPSHTRVFNVYEVSYFLWIALPQYMCKNLQLYQMFEVSTGELTEVNYTNMLYQDAGRPWIRVISHILNLSCGQHVYRLDFVDIETAEVVPLFFSYVLQDDSPDTPYVYMNRS